MTIETSGLTWGAGGEGKTTAEMNELFADIPESNNNIGLIEDQGDKPGKCERFLVKGYVEYPSGWGAGPTGPYSTHLVLVNLNNKWVIVGEGAPLVDGCTRAITTLGLEETPEDENDTPSPD